MNKILKRVLTATISAAMLASLAVPAASAYNDNFYFTVSKNTSTYSRYVSKDDNEQKAYITAYATSGWAQGKEYATFWVQNSSGTNINNLCRVVRAGNYTTTYKTKAYAKQNYRLMGRYEAENPYNYMNINGVWCP